MVTAQASVLEAFKEPLQLRNLALDRDLEKGAVMVRTEMAGICGTDVHLWKGELPIKLPVILGHETVGRIEQLGKVVTNDWNGAELKVGDRVTWNSTVSCGQCYYCNEKHQPTRCPERRAYGIGYQSNEPPHFLGGYAEYHYLRTRTTLFKLPDDLPIEAVIGAGCALITAIHGVERMCVENAAALGSSPIVNPSEEGSDSGKGTDATAASGFPILPELWRETVVVQGAGPVGISAIAVARAAGAEQIIVVGGPRHRLEMALRFGANRVINIDEVLKAEDRVQAVREFSRGYGADVVLECAGVPGAVPEGIEMCRDGAKLLVLGHYCDAGEVSFNPHLITRKQLQVFGSWSSEPRHLKAALDFLRTRRDEFPFHSMVTHRFSLEQANEALQTTARWESAKSVIVP